MLGLACVVVCLGGMNGCHKGSQVSPGGGGDGIRGAFEANLADATQEFQLDAVNGGSLIGANGVVVNFPPNAFRTQSGGLVTGSVTVRLIEVLDLADMIMLNTTTVGNDNGTLRLLKSGGAVRVSASQGGNELALGPMGMSITVPAQVFDPSMSVFTANRTGGEELVWTEEDSASIDSTFMEWPNGGTGMGYYLQVDSLQWINCDYFPWSTQNTTIAAVTPSEVPDDSTLVWFVFPDLNAVAGTYAATNNTFTFGQVPVGLQAVAVGLTRNGSQYSSAFTSFTTSANGSVGLSFQPTTLAVFEAAVGAL